MTARMMSQLEQDVLWAIDEKVAVSYAALHRTLRMYGPLEIVETVNSLHDQGLIQQGAGGFERACSSELDAGWLPTSAEASNAPSAQAGASSGLSAVVGAANEEEPSGLSGNSSDSDEGEGDQIESSREGDAASAAEEDTCVISEPISAISEGTVMMYTPAAALEFPDHVQSDLEKLGIEWVCDLVKDMPRVVAKLGRDRASLLIEKLRDLSGEPPARLSTDDVNQLCLLSQSKLFYFDWLGVLCTVVDRSLSRDDIRTQIDDGRLDMSVQEEFSFSEYAKTCSDKSLEADRLLCSQLEKRRYSLNANAFHVIMLPILEEQFDMGEYDDAREAVHGNLNWVTKLFTTENACFGKLRDDFQRLKKESDGLGTSKRIAVGSDDCFISAAEKLASIEPCCEFVLHDLALKCLSDSQGELRRQSRVGR